MLRVLLAIFGCVACSVTSFAGGPFGIIDVGRWQGAAYTNDKGPFSYCIAVSKTAGGIGLVIAQHTDRSWLIGFADATWHLPEGQSVPIVLTFDGQQFEISATAREKVIAGTLPSQALNAFRKSRLLVATASKRTIQFDLAAAGNVVPAIEYCVDRMKTNGVGAAGDFSNPKSSNTQAKPPTAKASAKSEDEAPEKPSDPGKLVDVSGSGFVVSKNAHIVTNNHVVGDCVGDIHGNLAGQAPVKLRVVSTDETNDLALLQGAKKFKEKDIATIRASAVNSGDQVVAIGYPLHGPPPRHRQL
jgi:Trypsin-like peptidase domain